MASLIVSTIIHAPLLKVWRFHMDPRANLSQANGGVEVIEVDMPLQEGSRVRVRVPRPVGGACVMQTVITEFHPPHAVLFGQEARFTDVQEEGPFAVWAHSHEMETTEQGCTLLRDVITYHLRGGVVGSLPLALPARLYLRSRFRARGRRIKRLLDE
jgi:ligand-binding SRPBCC domain-containing protein